MNAESCAACSTALAPDDVYPVEASPIPFAAQAAGTSFALCAACHARWGWDVLEAASWERWASDPSAEEPWIAALRVVPAPSEPLHPR